MLKKSGSRDNIVFVNLHCHSTCSDGVLNISALAQHLAANGVTFAALTDHDTIEGIAQFGEIMRRHGVNTVSGVEISTSWQDKEVHLLAYGFDPHHAGLKDGLYRSRQAHVWATQSITNAMRGGNVAANTSMSLLPLPEAITLVHQAGGIVFLAHPFTFASSISLLRTALKELRNYGLDGIEAIYAPYRLDARQALLQLADELGLLVSAGSDFHSFENESGINLPLNRWQTFRNALRPEAITAGRDSAELYSHARRNSRNAGLRFVLPIILSFVLFAVTFWGFLKPSFERALLDRKRETIRELTHSAWSMLDAAEKQVIAGHFTRDAAQAEMRENISAMRYGHENKDYFWLQDLQPRMIMHPYRPDLENSDLTDFKDARGVPIFVQFAEMMQRRSEGYVDYVWQWPDDPRRLEPKESYIKLFEPWGWIIGTGLYVEDVQQEIGKLERGFLRAGLAITVITALLLFYAVRHGRKLDKARIVAIDELNGLTERYQALVEVATEGTLIALNGRCRYANPSFLSMLNYSASELQLLDLSEVLPHSPVNEAIWLAIEALQHEPDSNENIFSGELTCRNGTNKRCQISIARIAFSGEVSIALMARTAGSKTLDEISLSAEQEMSSLMDLPLPIGIFTATDDDHATVLQMSPTAKNIFAKFAPLTENTQLKLADICHDQEAYHRFLEQLRSSGMASILIRSNLSLASGDVYYVSIKAVTSLKDGNSRHEIIHGTIEDVTQKIQRENERETQIERLQSTLLFMHAPVTDFQQTPIKCKTNSRVNEVAALLASERRDAALVLDNNGQALGIVTATDLCTRVLARGVDMQAPIGGFMSAPLHVISNAAPIYEALQRMQELNIRHLAAVSEENNMVSGLLTDRDILPFQQYGSAILAGEISKAPTIKDVIRVCRRIIPTSQTLLKSGAQPGKILHFVSTICDAATNRFIKLAMEELGPPPAKFAFIAFGSHGRSELTPYSDQDNAIIFEQPEHIVPSSAVTSYFQQLGDRVCDWLNRAGFAYCHGKFMAQNPVWVRDFEAWKSSFHYWINHAEPKELMLFSVFFDFREVYGDVDLVARLRRFLAEELAKTPAFFPQLARQALVFRPPVMLFGRFYNLPRMNGQRKHHVIDIKAALLPIIAFARLYALKNGVGRTHTLERLDTLCDAGVLNLSSKDEIAATYNFLMRLRLQGQLATDDLSTGIGENRIDTRKLKRGERVMLRQAFGHTKILQRRIAYDFLGGNFG